MPRRPRIMLSGVPLHIIQRGNNRQICFAADEDYQQWLEEYACKAGRYVHTPYRTEFGTRRDGGSDQAGNEWKRVAGRWVVQ